MLIIKLLYLDAATIRSHCGLCKSALHRRLEHLASLYPPLPYGNRLLFPIGILEAFSSAAITMPPQKDNASTPTLKNDSHA